VSIDHLVVYVQIREDDAADDAWLEGLARSLLKELRDRGLEASRPVGEAPEGAKSGATSTLATLVIALAGSPGVVALASALLDWVRHGRQRHLRLTAGDSTIEISSLTAAQQDRTLTAWLESHLPTQDPEDGS